MSNIELVGSSFTSNKPYLFRAVYEWILDNGGTPYLLVDATYDKVQVPQEFAKDGQIVLNASPSAIQEWFVDNQAVSFSARFSGKAQNIYIPMESLLATYAQENGAGMAFPLEDIEQPKEEGEIANVFGNLQGVKSSGAKGADFDEADVEDLDVKKKPKTKALNGKKGTSHLKVIK